MILGYLFGKSQTSNFKSFDQYIKTTLINHVHDVVADYVFYVMLVGPLSSLLSQYRVYICIHVAKQI